MRVVSPVWYAVTAATTSEYDRLVAEKKTPKITPFVTSPTAFVPTDLSRRVLQYAAKTEEELAALINDPDGFKKFLEDTDINSLTHPEHLMTLNVLTELQFRLGVISARSSAQPVSDGDSQTTEDVPNAPNPAASTAKATPIAGWQSRNTFAPLTTLSSKPNSIHGPIPPSPYKFPSAGANSSADPMGIYTPGLGYTDASVEPKGSNFIARDFSTAFILKDTKREKKFNLVTVLHRVKGFPDPLIRQLGLQKVFGTSPDGSLRSASTPYIIYEAESDIIIAHTAHSNIDPMDVTPHLRGNGRPVATSFPAEAPGTGSAPGDAEQRAHVEENPTHPAEKAGADKNSQEKAGKKKGRGAGEQKKGGRNNGGHNRGRNGRKATDAIALETSTPYMIVFTMSGPATLEWGEMQAYEHCSGFLNLAQEGRFPCLVPSQEEDGSFIVAAIPEGVRVTLKDMTKILSDLEAFGKSHPVVGLTRTLRLEISERRITHYPAKSAEAAGMVLVETLVPKMTKAQMLVALEMAVMHAKSGGVVPKDFKLALLDFHEPSDPLVQATEDKPALHNISFRVAKELAFHWANLTKVAIFLPNKKAHMAQFKLPMFMEDVESNNVAFLKIFRAKGSNTTGARVLSDIAVQFFDGDRSKVPMVYRPRPWHIGDETKQTAFFAFVLLDSQESLEKLMKVKPNKEYQFRRTIAKKSVNIAPEEKKKQNKREKEASE